MPAGGQHDRGRQERHEVDDAERGEGIREPVGQRGAVALGVPRHGPQPRQIFEREHDDGEDGDRANSVSNRASSSGTEARIIATTSSTMTLMITWMKRDPIE